MSGEVVVPFEGVVVVVVVVPVELWIGVGAAVVPFMDSVVGSEVLLLEVAGTTGVEAVVVVRGAVGEAVVGVAGRSEQLVLIQVSLSPRSVILRQLGNNIPQVTHWHSVWVPHWVHV